MVRSKPVVRTKGDEPDVLPKKSNIRSKIKTPEKALTQSATKALEKTSTQTKIKQKKKASSQISQKSLQKSDRTPKNANCKSMQN